MNTPYLDVALVQLENLTSELLSAKQSFEESHSKLSSDVAEQRRNWLSSRPRDMGGREEQAWRKLDPEILNRDDVRASVRRVSELKSQLRQAEGDLSALIENGSSRSRFAKQILFAGSTVRSLIASREKPTVEELIYDTFKTRNLKEVPRLILENAKFNPAARRFARFPFVCSLDPNKWDTGELELQAAYTVTVSAINRLIELIKQG